jgi:hypothetical protein
MVAGGVLASAGYAQADSAADGETAGSPGVLSGNSVQVPVHIPVNVCGNTVDVVGLLNPAFGNRCANASGTQRGGASSGTYAGSGTHPGQGSAPHANRPARHAGAPADESAWNGSRSGGGAHAIGDTTGSPGVIAGNALKLPLDLPVNLSGNSANVVGIGNPAFGNTAVNTETPPPPAHQPIPAPPNEPSTTPAALATPVTTATSDAGPTLAHTGADGLGPVAGGSVALLLGGTVLYRRGRATARR